MGDVSCKCTALATGVHVQFSSFSGETRVFMYAAVRCGGGSGVPRLEGDKGPSRSVWDGSADSRSMQT